MTIALKYTLFAVLATLLNLLAQEAVARIYDGAFALYLAMGCGTGAGLVCKYLLDK
ncbi:MAG: GtrA family protein, partial [Gammaproteobacteria bacterium]|nr:GtrA family protein [Gammaproteobacteria bacterium]